MTEEQKQALIEALDVLWACADAHPAASRALQRLRKALELPEGKYRT